MIAINSFPRNKDHFTRLAIFAREILDICKNLNITPILDGSLAVFAHTKNPDMDVNDIDLSCSEAEFPKLIIALESRGISYQLREWHVLQITQGDLKIELGSQEYWLKDLAIDLDTLQTDGYAVKILSLNSLKELYRRGMDDRAKWDTENDRLKHERLKAKYEALVSLDDQNR
jgi:hypothetical protein